MNLASRKLINRVFTSVGVLSILLMAATLVVIMGPIVERGLGAFIFRGTVEHRRVLLQQFGRGDREALEAESREVAAARRPVYDLLEAFEAQLTQGPAELRRQYRQPLNELKQHLQGLLGPFPGKPEPVLLRDRYGETRWDQARARCDHIVYAEHYDYSDPSRMGLLVRTPRAEQFAGTVLEPLFTYVPAHLEEMLRPRWTCYARFLTDVSYDSHFFGGIGPELLGTFYLTIGAILFAVPLGVVSAIYLTEYARPGSRVVALLRTCISTLAGVPSIVFGLFGLAFFINTLRVSPSKSVLAGSLTLGLLILPLVIRAAEEAIRSVPETYKLAALSLGATRWRTMVTVLLPAALPGILTGIVISMGRAAGETAPIIFTAAVSVGQPLALWQTFTEPTPALPWNIFNLCSEHQAVDEIRHVQYGMVFTLVLLVLLLNSTAIFLRARISRKLRG
ncbi:MAG TPA: phosphate ABC transporter permease PstA [Phycisphaerae bacterium]|nr:phosphate ABC transporter permease PstA [Phycisphaerae bacterium]HNU46878.1 phosphate ABC transporter permease PstA [Phycisphaerae bacterium]